MHRNLILYIALCVILFIPASAVQSLPRLTPIFTAGTHGHSCYRVPSAVQAPSGSLLVFVEARGKDCSDNTPKDVMLSRSQDNGTSWSAPIMVFPGFAVGLTYRNPTAVFSRIGALILQIVNTTLEPWHTLQLVSYDEGVSWSPPHTPALGPSDGFLAGPANGLLLKSASSPAPGRLLMCGTNYYDPSRPTGAPVGARAWYTDDPSGAPGSWTSPADSLVPNMAECAMAELGNGSVLINFRANHLNPCQCRAQVRTDDGGVTFSPLAFVPDLIEPVCSAGLLELPAGQGLLFSNPASKTSRLNMTVHRSRDGGSTWPDRVQIWPGGSAYSVLVPVAGAPVTAGIVFETMDATGVNSIVFALVPPF